MTLQQLRYVVTVAETGNITEAAKRLFISQPSLTKAVRELETEMQSTGGKIQKHGQTESALFRVMPALFLCGKRFC